MSSQWVIGINIGPVHRFHNAEQVET